MAEIVWKHRSNEAGKEKSVKHYSSNHQILLVGEGDFSFSLSLAISFGTASNIVATSLDSYDVLIHKYKRAKSNLESLGRFGAQLIHVVDAIKMKLHTDLRMRKFDRIVYNFPHAGFLGSESNHSVITMHRHLVRGFFMNACAMLRPNGEVHVTHKTEHPYHYWNIKELATQSGLLLVECVKFNNEAYPGYNNKRGAGKNSDKPFPLGECSTFKFVVSLNAIKPTVYSHHRTPRQPQENPLPRMNHMIKRKKHTYSAMDMLKIGFHTYKVGFKKFNETHEKTWDCYTDLLEELKFGFERYNPLDGCVNLLEEELRKQTLEFLYNLIED